jgi:hypothetical protein
MDGTIIQQGTFTSTGVPVTIQLASGVNWMYTYNYTQASTATQYTSPYSYWQQGLANNDCFYQYKNAGTTILSYGTCAVGPAANPGAIAGYTFINNTVGFLGPAVATTANTNVAAPVVSTGSTAGFVANSTMVVLSGIAATQNICGPEFLVTAFTANTNFTIQTLATAPGAAGGAGFYRVLNYLPYWYPSRRYIASITAAASAVVTTTIPHGYTVGQIIRFEIPAVCGMVQLNGLAGTVTAVTASTFTVNINSSAFTAFTFPTAAQMPSSYGIAVPVGEDSTVSPNVLADATLNNGYIGMVLGAGLGSPAGQNADVIYWAAGKSFNL